MTRQAHPWLTPAAALTPAPEDSAALTPPLTGPAGPHHGVPETDSVDRLPRRTVSAPAALWTVGAHGGAGETVLAGLLPGARPAQHAWPVVDPELETPRVLLACRSHADGLRSAQHALTDWASPSAGLTVELLGLVVSADAPGQLPKPLRDFAAIVGGGAPRVWHLPWIPSWRFGQDLHEPPREVRSFIRTVTTLLG